MPSLVIRGPDGAQTTVQLSERPIRLGRADTCDVVLRDDGEVSRAHAEVWADEHNHVHVTDLNSKNGTRIDAGELFRNESHIAYKSIHVGEHQIEIVGAAEPEEGTATPVTFVADGPRSAGGTRFFPSSKRLDLSQQRLELLMGLAERLGGIVQRKQLLEQALDACCEALAFERGLVALKTPRGEPELPVTRNVQTDETGAFKISRTLINRALIHGERAVVNDPATDLVGNLSESLVRYPICSALCVPILYRDEILGVIYGDRITRASTYKPADVDFLAAIAQQLGIGLANLKLFQEHLRSQRMYAEIEQARAIHRRLLPEAPLRIGRACLEGYNRPSSAIGGDAYDYYEIGAGRIGLTIADVTGHGLPAAIMMANLQAAAQVALTGKSELPELAARVNRLVCRNTSSHVFITAILGILDTRTGVLEYVSAGHPGPILAGGGRVRIPDEENSLPLGIDPEDEYAVRRIRLGEQAEAVLFYTDGLVEATDGNDRQLGTGPLVKALSELPEPTTETVLRTALRVVGDHLGDVPNADDMTLLAIHFER